MRPRTCSTRPAAGMPRNIVLLFAAKDTKHNHAQVLQEVLQDLAD